MTQDMQAVNIRFGRAVKMAIVARGIPQYRYAQAIGIAPNHLSQIIQGHKMPSWPLAVRLARDLGLDLTRLVEPPETIYSSISESGVFAS